MCFILGFCKEAICRVAKGHPGKAQLVFRWGFCGAHYNIGARTPPAREARVRSTLSVVAYWPELRPQLSIHRDCLGEPSLPYASCKRSDPPTSLVQLRALVFDLAASAFYGVDGCKPASSSTSSILCLRFLSSEHHISRSDMGVDRESKGERQSSQNTASAVSHHPGLLRHCRRTGADLPRCRVIDLRGSPQYLPKAGTAWRTLCLIVFSDSITLKVELSIIRSFRPYGRDENQTFHIGAELSEELLRRCFSPAWSAVLDRCPLSSPS